MTISMNPITSLTAAGTLAAGLLATNAASADMASSNAPTSFTVFGGMTGGSGIGHPSSKLAGLAGIHLGGPIGSTTGSGDEDSSFLASLRWNTMGIFSGGGVSFTNGDRSFGTRLCGGLSGGLGYFGDTSFGFRADLDLCGGFSYLERSKGGGGYGGIVGAMWRGGLYISIDNHNMYGTIKNWKIMPGILGFVNFWGLTPESSALNPWKFEKSGLANVPGPKFFPFLELGFGF